MGGLDISCDCYSAFHKHPHTHKLVWQEEVELVHPQGWEGEGRSKTGKNPDGYLASPSPRPKPVLCPQDA